MSGDPSPSDPAIELPQIVVSPEQPRRQRVSQTPEPSASPPFGVGHLLLIAFYCSAYFGLVRFLSSWGPVAWGLLGVATATWSAIGTALAWTGLTVFISRRVRRKSWPIEPGEWLVAIVGCFYALSTAQTLARSAGWLEDNKDALIGGITCCLLAIPTFSRRLAVSAKVLFGCLAIVLASQLVAFAWLLSDPASNDAFQLVQRVKFWTSPLLLIVVLLSAAWDYRRAQHRTWLHWLGLLVTIWLWVVPELIYPLLRTDD